LGFDYALLSNKISGSIEYFSKLSTDVLGNRPNDPTTGWSSITSNYASISNNGIEFGINAIVLKTKTLAWSVGLNYTYLKNEILEVEPALNDAKIYLDGGAGAALEGYPISALNNYVSGGLTSTGDYITITADGSEVIGSEAYGLELEDLVFSGQVSPKYYGGFNTSLSYLKFTLSVNFTYQGGHVSRYPMPDYAYVISGNTHESIANTWQIAGDENKEGILPSIQGPDYNTTQWRVPAFRTDNRVFDASHIRLRNIVLSYNTNIKSKINLQIFGEIKNVAVFTKNELDIDPASINPYTGQLRFTEPRSFIIGIKTNF
jgi:hypothetical protein